MKNQLYIPSILVMILIGMSSCAPAEYTEHTYGLLSGIWHGFIILFSLIGKLFGADVGLYAQNNTGFFYWLGFIIGVVGLGGGGLFSRK